MLGSLTCATTYVRAVQTKQTGGEETVSTRVEWELLPSGVEPWSMAVTYSLAPWPQGHECPFYPAGRWCHGIYLAFVSTLLAVAMGDTWRLCQRFSLLPWEIPGICVNASRCCYGRYLAFVSTLVAVAMGYAWPVCQGLCRPWWGLSVSSVTIRGMACTKYWTLAGRTPHCLRFLVSRYGARVRRFGPLPTSTEERNRFLHSMESIEATQFITLKPKRCL